MKFDWIHGPLAEGLHLYNMGEFFAAHEAWESVWLTTPQPGKTFLQGLIQVTVAFHHMQRNNPLGTARLLQAALRKVESYPPNFGGIDTTLLCDDIRDRLHSLTGIPPSSSGVVILTLNELKGKNPRICVPANPSAASADTSSTQLPAPRIHLLAAP